MADQELRYADAARRYRLDEPIATGGMGHVWRGTDTLLDRPVAVKLLKQEYAGDAVFRSRFESEARHAAGLRHPGVAQVFDVGTLSTDAPFLVMEYVDGQPLSSLLRSGQPMDPDAAAVLLAEAADAIGAAHAQGIVHRDVKPANLLVTDDRHVKITDFGIARAADAVALTRTGEVMGTPQYLSPEQAEGRTATPASDVYSLGVVAFECLAGRRPYVADSAVATALAHLREPVPDLPGDVPPALAAVVRRALAKDPADRYPDGTAFAAAVRAAVSAVPAGPAPTRVMTAVVPLATTPPPTDPVAGVSAGTVDAWREHARRVPVPVWAAAGVFVVVIAVAALANATGGGGSASSPTTTPHSPPTSTSTSTTTSTTPLGPTTPTPSATGPAPHQSKPPKPPKPPEHGHHHGHKGKGHT